MTTHDHHIQIREMTRAELDMSLGWAAAEGWNPGIHDADCFYATGASSFLMGFDKGEPYGSISAVKYGHYAFMGLYMVNPAHRQEGIGTQLGDAALARVEGLDLGLDGVMEQVATYQSLGFKVAYNNSRYRGTAGGDARESDPRIVDLSDIPFDDLRAYDESVFMAPRPEFLACWVNMPDSVALGIQENGQLAGYTVLRKCQEGYKYGPLFADSPEMAEALFNAAGTHIPAGTPVFLDVPGANAAAVELATRHNMDSVFSTARMYRMANPGTQMNLPLHRWFGVTTLELG